MSKLSFWGHFYKDWNDHYGQKVWCSLRIYVKLNYGKALKRERLFFMVVKDSEALNDGCGIKLHGKRSFLFKMLPCLSVLILFTLRKILLVLKQLSKKKCPLNLNYDVYFSCIMKMLISLIIVVGQWYQFQNNPLIADSPANSFHSYSNILLLMV